MHSERKTPDRLRLLLEADRRPGLLPLLEEATGADVAGRYRLDALVGVGRQSYIFGATDLHQGAAVILKQCAFDYRNPLLYNRASAGQLRQGLRREYEVLQACDTGNLPRPLELLTAASPIPAAAESPVLANDDVFLVEELIVGKTLAEVALEHWPSLRPSEREAIAAGLVMGFTEFWEALQGRGWRYGDISADNLLVEGTDRLRVVDAGSAVPAHAKLHPAGYTPAFTTPRLFAALREGREIPSNLAGVLPMMAKVVHFALTRREPLNGELPDLDEPRLAEYSPRCRQTLAHLLLLDSQPGELAGARDSLASWAAR